MILSTNNIAYYLLERGMLTSKSVVDGDFMVVEASRRNRNFKVIRKNHPSYFVKQIQNWEPQAVATIQREAACYWLAQNDENFAPLASLIPKYYLHDPVRNTLIVELLSDGEDLSEYHRRLRKFPTNLAALVGTALGTYHREAGTKLNDKPQGLAFPKAIPWILSVHQQNALHLNPSSAANSQLLNIIQKHQEFQQVLDSLRSQWQTNSLIHGDMKWENCIVYERDGEQNLKVVDWELSDFGDACWDVGAIFQAYLSFWILSIQITSELSPEQFAERAQYPLEEMQPAIQEFWQTYLRTREVNDQTAKELLERSVKYCAARMIQTVYEYMNYSPQISANALALLQVSLNILTKPSEAIRDLLAMQNL